MAANSHAVLSARLPTDGFTARRPSGSARDFEDNGSIYALEGTCAHALAEYKLRKALGYPADDPTENLDFYNEEMDEATDGYVSYVLEQVQAAKEDLCRPDCHG
jgi:DICT domain-containing protein